MAFDNIHNDRPIVTRKEAIARGEKYYFTGKPCPKGHVDTRYVGGGCVPCERERVRKANDNKYKSCAAYRERAITCSRKRHEEIKSDPDKLALANKSARQRYRDRLRDAEYAREARVKWRAQKRAYYESSPGSSSAQNQMRRARVAGAEGHHTASDLVRIMKRQKYRCVYCSKSVRKKYHADHIMPLALGGSNWPSNMQILCPACNMSKGAKRPEDFARERGRLL